MYDNMEKIKMIKKVVWVRIITLVIVPFISFIAGVIFLFVIANLEKMTIDNDAYEVDDDAPLFFEVSNLFTSTNERYRTSISNKGNNSFTVVYSIQDITICTFDVLIDGGNITLDYSEHNPYSGIINHDGSKPIQFQFSNSVCDLGQFGIYVERNNQLSDLIPAVIVGLVILVLISLINIKVRQDFINTLDIYQFRATKLEASQKIIYILIGFFAPMVALILFLILGTDTKNYKNIKSTELALLTGVITVLLSMVSITIMVGLSN